MSKSMFGMKSNPGETSLAEEFMNGVGTLRDII
jgi:hypothetical protein